MDQSHTNIQGQDTPIDVDTSSRRHQEPMSVAEASSTTRSAAMAVAIPSSDPIVMPSIRTSNQPGTSVASLTQPLVQSSSTSFSFGRPKPDLSDPSDNTVATASLLIPHITSLHPLPIQLGGHAGSLATDRTGSLIIKRSSPREIAFYLYLRSIARELHAEEYERLSQAAWESHGLGRAISTGKTLLGRASEGFWNAPGRVLGVSQSAGQVIGNAGWAVGRQFGDLAEKAGAGKGRLRALTVPTIEWGSGAGSGGPDGSAGLPTAQSSSNRLSTLFNKLPKIPISTSGGFALPSLLGSAKAVEGDAANERRIGLEPEEEHGIDENAARKNVDEIRLVDGQAPTASTDGQGSSEVVGTEVEDGRARADKLLREMKGIRLSKGKGKQRTGSTSTVASGSGSMSPSRSTSLSTLVVSPVEEEVKMQGAKESTTEADPKFLSANGAGPGIVESGARLDTGSSLTVTREEREPDARISLAKLIPFLPKFHGTLNVEGVSPTEKESGQGGTIESVVLRNILASFTRPAAIDIKLGTVLYDATSPVSDEKRRKMEQKAKKTTSAETGLKFSGFQTWNDYSQQFEVSPREYGSSLTADRLPEAMAKYTPVFEPSPSASSSGLISPDRHRENVARVLCALAGTLRSLHAVVEELDIRFIGTSLLIAYEASPSHLDRAWRAVDSGTASSNGLESVLPERQDEEVPTHGPTRDTVSKAEKALKSQSSTKPQDGASIEDRLTEDAAEFEMETSLTDEMDVDKDGGQAEEVEPRASKSGLGSGLTLRQATPDQFGGDHDSQPTISPFQLRLIDFAHTRLAPGEGRDQGFLKGLTTLIELVEGRIRDLRV